ncbi:cytochrome ubiquinol oxidase subunit I [Variovorax sp. PCZ-1]|uniref:cytochrome ubiquinol oxidase subunit I n=1 Tax=Variovorax sp. PCZ-1 TaxID=2835533 RepID=UPI001BCB06C8|nr:cytochrome ubiquinol oxidase subunit I [Variovorax sp. PCZ-1]MBS7806467.1 cytochrome ubiquinol oxidase subunit I [Variovorax sp. PCZ-1]
MSDSFDPLILHRIQFAANISFHILFPTITIALAWVLVFFKWRFARTQDAKWMDAYFFWVKVFALTFALGVVSGITMSFQFGTNWPGFMNTVGNIAGPLLAYEVMTAFFLEASFLGVMLFGLQRVGHRWHTVATLLVALGTSLSAFWILALNSWMQTPAGFEMRPNEAGLMVAHVTDWWAVIFNPSFPYRMSHMMMACFVTVAFLLTGISAYRWLRGDRAASVLATLRTGVVMAAVLVPAQIVLGDLHGLNTFKHQPAKLAAMEGIWETQRGAPAVIFGIPDEKARENKYEISIPKLASLYLTHELDGEVKGLNDFKGVHPPVAPVFWGFRVMVGTGMLMLAVGWLAVWQQRKGGQIKPWLGRVMVGMTFSGWVATLAGWYVTEIGRQPWLVTGVLTTKQAAASIPTPMLAGTLALYIVVYLMLLVSYISVLFYLARKAGSGETKASTQLAGSTA